MKKESFISSDWRNDLSEVINDIESKPIKEKKVNNKIKINPTMGEAVEAMGGTLLEEIEVDEFEGVVEEVYDELIEEGYSEDDVESALEQALIEARVTVGHDTAKPAGMRDKLKKKAKGFLGKVAVKAYNKAREAKAAAKPAVQRAKTSAKRGIRKMAQKVVDRMSEEVIGEAVYGGTKKPAPTDKRLTVTNADKAGNTPAYQKYKAGDKNYKAADHMKEGVGMHRDAKTGEVVDKAEVGKTYYPNMPKKKSSVALRKEREMKEGVRDVDPEKGTAERKARLEKKRGMKMDDHPQYKEEASMSPQEVQLQKKKAMLDKMIATKRMQGLKNAKKSEAPTKAMGEGLSIDQQMKISRDAAKNRKPYQPGDRQKQRAAQLRQMAKNAPKDTRTDAQKMTDATGPRPGSRYRGD